MQRKCSVKEKNLKDDCNYQMIFDCSFLQTDISTFIKGKGNVFKTK
jgi:hypothetical protein